MGEIPFVVTNRRESPRARLSPAGSKQAAELEARPLAGESLSVVFLSFILTGGFIILKYYLEETKDVFSELGAGHIGGRGGAKAR